MTSSTSREMAQNLADFQDEWVTLCRPHARQLHAEVTFTSPYPALNHAAKEIFLSEKSLSEHLNPPCFHVFLDTPAQSCCENVLSIGSVESDFSPSPDETMDIMHLSLPGIYGAGLAEGCGINHILLSGAAIPAIHVVDMFVCIIAALRSFTPGCFDLDHPMFSGIPRSSVEQQLQTLRRLYDFPDQRFYDDSAYGGLDLLHKQLMKCLLEVDRICTEHKIEYFLGGGTLLGAVRHQGFIPWDDDIDIMMSRKDFDRFSKIAPYAVSKDFFYQSSETDPDYHSPFTKIRLRNTLFETPFSSRFSYVENGIFLDIFAHDSAPSSKMLLKLHIFLTTFIRSAVFHKWSGEPMHYYGRFKLICKFVTAVSRLVSIKTLERLQRWIMTFWNHWHTGYLYDGMGEHLKHGCFPARVLEGTTYLLFEGHAFPVPSNYHEYLCFSYGEDYMTWPRPGLRRCHHTVQRYSFGTNDSE